MVFLIPRTSDSYLKGGSSKMRLDNVRPHWRTVGPTPHEDEGKDGVMLPQAKKPQDGQQPAEGWDGSSHTASGGINMPTLVSTSTLQTLTRFVFVVYAPSWWDTVCHAARAHFPRTCCLLQCALLSSLWLHSLLWAQGHSPLDHGVLNTH